MADDQFTCKECCKTGDYDAVPKRQDPRPGVRRVICQDCANVALSEMAGDGRTFSRPLVGAAPYQSNSESSQAGARSAEYKVSGQALQVLSCLADAGEIGLTCKQLEFITDMPVNECSRACNGLHAKSPYARKADFKRPNPDSGVMVQVYQITEAGRAYLAASKLGRAA